MDGFKQRLIGAIVLVSLAVIFIPMIFEEPHQEKTTEVLQIPAQPEVPAFTIESPRPPSRSPNSEEQTAADTSRDQSENAKRLMTVDEMKAAEQQSTAGNTIKPPKADDKPAYDDSVAADPDDKAVSDVIPETEQTEPRQPHNTSNQNSAGIAAADSGSSVSAGVSVSDSAWVVQIGTFRNRPGAIKIRNELRSSGTPSYTMDIVSGDIPMVRVFAGPTETKEAALALKQKVDKRYKLQSMVVTYKGNP